MYQQGGQIKPMRHDIKLRLVDKEAWFNREAKSTSVSWLTRGSFKVFVLPVQCYSFLIIFVWRLFHSEGLNSLHIYGLIPVSFIKQEGVS